jgi:5-methylcytosine-specific restriction endonuclease McrA
MKKGIYRHSQATKLKMSIAHKGQLVSKAQRAKISASRLARKARLGYLNSPSTRRKLSEGRTGEKNWNFGKPRSKETRKRIGDAQRGRKNRMWGKTHTVEARAKISARHKGERNSNWKGGITTPERLRFLHKRRQLRKLGNGGSHTFEKWSELKRRFNFTCPSCFRKEPEITLTEDHIVPISKGGSDDIENIQPLCQSCNSRKYLKTIRYLPAVLN